MSTTKSPGFEFVLKQLEANKDVAYATVRAAAEKAGFTIYPIMYGRAKAKLGLVEVAPRGSKKKRAATPTAASPPTVTPTAANPRPRAASAASVIPTRNGGAVGSLETVISAMKAGDAQRQRYRKALEQIQAILDDALAD